jgi:hypothetical protein
MRKLALAAVVTLPLVGGCYAEAYPPAYYARPSYVRVYGPGAYVPRPVYVAPRPVYVAPPRVRVYW